MHSGRALYPEFLHGVTDSCDAGHCLQMAASLQEAARTLQAPRLVQAETGWVMNVPEPGPGCLPSSCPAVTLQETEFHTCLDTDWTASFRWSWGAFCVEKEFISEAGVPGEILPVHTECVQGPMLSRENVPK